jgi:hypothetical protein
MKKKVLAALIICGSFCSHEVKAQSAAQQVMETIYKKYDSLSYITFDVKYVYGTDTLYGDFKHEELGGSYTMAGKKAKYNIGNIEFMQNDSSLISVYNKEKFIIVADPKYGNTGDELPMRAMMDSMIQAYGQHYNIITNTTAGNISFEKTDSLAQFTKFFIGYDVSTNFLNTIQYVFLENQLMNPDDTTGSPAKYAMRQKTLRIEFSNYRLDNFSPALYNENNYVWFEDGVCKPIDKYKGYKVYYSKSPYRH